MSSVLVEASRDLVRHPLRAATIVLSLALALGGSAALASIWTAAQRYATSHGDPDRLFVLWEDHAARGMGLTPASMPNFRDLREASRAMEVLGAFTDHVVVVGGAESLRVNGARCTASFLRIGGVQPQLGRLLTERDESGADGPVAVIGAGLWQRRFAGSPDVLGQSVPLDGVPHTIVGVMPPGVAFPPAFTVTAAGSQVTIQQPEIWTPLTPDPTSTRREIRFLFVVGQLRAGLAPAQARAELDLIADALRGGFPRENAGLRLAMVPLTEQVGGPARPLLQLLAGSVLLLWITALANGAGIALSGLVGRLDTVAIRKALGAGAPQIYGAHLASGALLGLLAALLALPVALLGTRALLGYLSGVMPGVAAPALDLRTVALLVAGGLASGLAMMLPSARTAQASDPGTLLRAGHIKSTAHSLRWVSLLVLGQIALGAAGIAGSAILLRSAARLQALDPGFRSGDVQLATLTIPGGAYTTSRLASLEQSGLAALRGLSAGAQASAVDHVPLGDSISIGTFTFESLPDRPDEDRPRAVVRAVSGSYFDLMGIATLDGRAFDSRDAEGTPLVAIINERFAAQYGNPGSALGQRIKRGRRESPNPWLTIVGVVPSTRSSDLRRDPGGEVYLPLTQSPPPGAVTFLFRPGPGASPASSTTQQALRGLDPDVPVSPVTRLDDVVARHLGYPRQHASVAAAMSGSALALAALGLFALTATALAMRREEFAVRLCLGATPGGIARQVGVRLLRNSLLAGTVGAAVAVATVGQLPGDTRLPVLDSAGIVVASVVVVVLAMAVATLAALRELRAAPQNLLGQTRSGGVQ
jgi:putative ABC transport system permease protein